MLKSGFLLVLMINLLDLWPSIATKTEIPIYSLVTDLEPLLVTQRFVIKNLAKIVAEKKTKLRFIKSELKRFKVEYNKTMENRENYLINNINEVTLIKRIIRDFNFAKKQTQKETESWTRPSSLIYPTGEDLDEAGRMVLRLQRVYLINITQLADGLLETKYGGRNETYRETFTPMTASDCFELSKVIYNNKFYKNGIQWLLEALRLFDKENPKLGLKKSDIIQAIINGYEGLKKIGKQIEWAKRLARLKSNYDNDIISDLKVKRDIQLYGLDKKYKAALEKKINKKLSGTDTVKQEYEKRAAKVEKAEREAYRKLCRKEETVPVDVKKRLKCWYYSGHHAFTRLARFRAEQLFVRPDILLLHNVLSDREIKTIINIARPKLDVVSVQEAKSERNSMYTNLSKGLLFNKEESRTIEPVTQRISDMSGYLATAGPLVVSNYGVGGYYLPHRDAKGWIEKDSLIQKLKTMKLKEELVEQMSKSVDQYMSIMDHVFRIATVLIYLSDVEQGGFTVFPLLGLAVPPEKGAALVWTNTLPSGEVDPLMVHGACPVLRGSKWVATKWINGIGQELQKPCTKKNTSRKSDSKLFQRDMNLCFDQKCITNKKDGINNPYTLTSRIILTEL